MLLKTAVIAEVYVLNLYKPNFKKYLYLRVVLENIRSRC